jgi:hypothetical protein
VFDGTTTHVLTDGNPGMASGGSGDTLTGIITGAPAPHLNHAASASPGQQKLSACCLGLLAQGLAPADAARLGAALHAKAADLGAGHALAPSSFFLAHRLFAAPFPLRPRFRVPPPQCACTVHPHLQSRRSEGSGVCWPATSCPTCSSWSTPTDAHGLQKTREPRRLRFCASVHASCACLLFW